MDKLIVLSKELMEMSLKHVAEAERLQHAARVLRGDTPGGFADELKPKPKLKQKRKLSPQALARISSAQKRRWARFHAQAQARARAKAKKGKKAA